jgi:type IV secretion system protein VirD4
MRSGTLILSRHVFFLIALFWAVSVLAAPVPRETLERLAEINVERAEIRQLYTIGNLSSADYNSRTAGLDKETADLWQPYRLASQITPEERQAATTTIDGLTRTKLSILEPRWQKEQAEFREAGKRRQDQTGVELEQDAHKAVRFQRERLLLQRQLDRKEIDQDTFTQKDREAQTAITALRKKFEDAGGGWPRRFDERLTLLTKAQADNLDTALPQSRVPATIEGQGPGRGGEPDFERDVKLAAEILTKEEENSFKFDKKQLSSDIFRETAVVYGNDRGRLRSRYQAISPKRGEQFEAAYTSMAAPALQALRMKYYPEKYRPAAPTGQRTQPPPPATDYSLYYWIGGGVLLLLIIGYFGKDEKTVSPAPAKPSDIHGSAQWVRHHTKPTAERCVRRGVTFGKSSYPKIPANTIGAPVTSLPETHSLIVARTRAGKGTRVILPTLLRYDQSMLVIDPKGENAAVTGRIRRDSLGHKVHILNPWGELAEHYASLGFSTATYNPLDALDRNDPNVVAIAQNFATTICPTPADSRDPFWSRSAANILTAVLLWITDRPDEQKTLARAREIVTLSRSAFKRAFMTKMVKSDAFSGAIRELVGQYHDLADETYGSIATHVIESTKFISDPQIKASTASSSFSTNDILDEYMTVFLVIPHDRIETHATWLRLVIASTMQAIKKRARITPPRHHRCMFLIDEFGSIGHMTGLPQDIAIMAGYGLDFTLVVQGLDQLEHHYGPAKNTILSNCGFKWFCYIADLDTAKYLSQTLGKKTVATTSKSQSTGTSGQNPTAGESTSHGETGRDLLTPDEILNLGRDVAILLNPSTAPYYLRPVDYWDLTRKFAHLAQDYPSLYWKPPLAYDDNPYINKPTPSNSTYTTTGTRTTSDLEALFNDMITPASQKPPDTKNPSGT